MLRVWTVALLALCAAAPTALELELPEASDAVVIEAPSTRVEVWADNTIHHGAKSWDTGGDFILADLALTLQAFHPASPSGLVLVAGDRRADFRAIRRAVATSIQAGVSEIGLLAAPDGQPPRALRLALGVAPTHPIVQPGNVGPGLTIDLAADSLSLARPRADVVRLPHKNDGLDLARLALLLDEDRRLHPHTTLVVIHTDDGVPYANTLAVLDLTGGKGYRRPLLSGGPVAAARRPITGPATASTPLPALEIPVSVELMANGDAHIRGADSSLEPIRHAKVIGYESHCEADTCDLVLRTETRRIYLGSRPPDPYFPEVFFGRPVESAAARLGLPEPKLEGRLSPLVQSPVSEAPDGPGGHLPVILGTLEIDHMDTVVKAKLEPIRECYSRLLAANRQAEGKVVVAFVVGRDGLVSSAVIKSSDITDEGFQKCITGEFKPLVFDKPEGGGIVIITYPFIFSPE